MINVGVVGLGKMGLSHLAIIRTHPDVTVTAICDPSRYVLEVLGKYTGLTAYTDYSEMLDRAELDAVVIATPSHLHAAMVEQALRRGLHVFCEKPLFLSPTDGVRLTTLAEQNGLVTQVGYHNRFVGTFAEVKRLLDTDAIGAPMTAVAEAYGPVALKEQGRGWRSHKTQGGGALYDYAAHPLDLLTWYFGIPDSVAGSRLTPIFSKDTEDTVSSSLRFGPLTALLSVNWSDESQRKMTTAMTIWGTQGKIHVDRQELRVYRRQDAPILEDYPVGWTVRYTTDLTSAPWFYVRGEEYSDQLDAFVERVKTGETEGTNTFASASLTDQVIAMVAGDATAAPHPAEQHNVPVLAPAAAMAHTPVRDRVRRLLGAMLHDWSRIGVRRRARTAAVRTSELSDVA